MRFKYPEGYLSPGRDPGIILNGREFTPDSFADLISPRPGEPVGDHARRVAAALGVAFVLAHFSPPESRSPWHEWTLPGSQA